MENLEKKLFDSIVTVWFMVEAPMEPAHKSLTKTLPIFNSLKENDFDVDHNRMGYQPIVSGSHHTHVSITIFFKDEDQYADLQDWIEKTRDSGMYVDVYLADDAPGYEKQKDE